MDNQFSFKYSTSGGAKLPVIAFYSIYKIIINEVFRYKDCVLKQLGSHTASDRTSNSAGDIEIFKNGKLFEAIEIKLNKQINANTVRIVREKIIKYNPKRYYILSYDQVNKKEINIIDDVIKSVKTNHGCQIIINGVIPTLKYYMRLLSDLGEFLTEYSNLIQKDSELKPIHKYKWKNFLSGLQNDL